MAVRAPGAAPKGWPEGDYPAFVRDGAVAWMKADRQPSPDEQRIVTPAWALDRAAAIGAEMATNIAALGVRIIGDIAGLAAIPPGMAQAAAELGPASLQLPAEAAVQAVAGAFVAGGVGGQAPEQILSAIQAKIMMRVLFKRGTQRLRRTLLPRGVNDGR
ncbi:MAG TPA: hypothetical protein VFB06_10925 [Streptosporangiaceae bacterium]|nr:hypothetical protein [Streptosporangiaceae bacterium]